MSKNHDYIYIQSIYIFLINDNNSYTNGYINVYVNGYLTALSTTISFFNFFILFLYDLISLNADTNLQEEEAV